MTRRSGGVAALVTWAAAAALVAGCGSVPDTDHRPTPRAVSVAVVDTGVDPATPLGGRLDEDASTSTVTEEGLHPTPAFADYDGHGTAMASIVHAAAPRARLIAIRAFGADGTSDARVADGIDRARKAGADVVLVPLAGAEPLPRTRAAIERAGRHDVVVVAAAGNDGLDVDRNPTYPASYDEPNLIAVAAVDRSGHLLGTSNRGPTVTAEGRGIGVPACTLDGAPRTVTGTSPASALVAGRAARLLRSGLAVDDLRRRLEAEPARPAGRPCG